MKKLLQFFFSSFVLFSVFLFWDVQKVEAVVDCRVQVFHGPGYTNQISNIPHVKGVSPIPQLSFSVTQPDGGSYSLFIEGQTRSGIRVARASVNLVKDGNKYQGSLSPSETATLIRDTAYEGEFSGNLVVFVSDANNNKICLQANSTHIPLAEVKESCTLSSQICKRDGGKLTVTFSGTYENFLPNKTYYVKEDYGSVLPRAIPFQSSSSGNGSFQLGQYLEVARVGEIFNRNYCVTGVEREVDACSYGILNCTASIAIDAGTEVPNCKDIETFPSVPPEANPSVPFELCNQVDIDTERNACFSCFEKDGIWTAVGCINYKDPTQTIRSFIVLGLGIGGGIVVLMTLAGAFLLSTSQGDPKRVDEAKSLISSAVIGIVFVIFSITILRFIGVRVLRIPGFGG